MRVIIIRGGQAGEGSDGAWVEDRPGLVGDRLVDRFGQRTVARAGGVLVMIGMGAALAWPSIPLTIVGFGLAGLGVATTIPAAMHEADELPGFRPGTGLTILSWTLRLGFLLSPVLVGIIADAVSLRIGLTLVIVAGLLIVVFSQALSQKPRIAAVHPAGRRRPPGRRRGR